MLAGARLPSLPVMTNSSSPHQVRTDDVNSRRSLLGRGDHSTIAQLAPDISLLKQTTYISLTIPLRDG